MTWLIRKIKKFSRKKNHQFRWMHWNLIDHCLKDSKKKKAHTRELFDRNKRATGCGYCCYFKITFSRVQCTTMTKHLKHMHTKSLCTLMYSFWCFFFVGDKIAFYSLQSILVAISFVSPIFFPLFFHSFLEYIFITYARHNQHRN